MTAYCQCESPIMDVEHDAGCRRCGLPVDFSPRPPEVCPGCGGEGGITMTTATEVSSAIRELVGGSILHDPTVGPLHTLHSGRRDEKHYFEIRVEHEIYVVSVEKVPQ